MNQDKSPDNLHIYEGVAECTLNDDDTLKNTKQRAKDLAKIDACKKIDDYIQLFFKNKSFNLPEDEISAISIEIANVIDVKYQMQSSDNDNMIVRAAVTVQFDDNDIINHLDKFFRDKSALVEQNEALRQKLTELEKQQDKDSQQISSLAAQNEELRKENEDLKRQRDNNHQINSQVVCEDKLSLSKQKFDVAMKLYGEDKIKLLDEVIELNPNYALAYNNRGNAYQGLKQYERAIQDYSEAIELNPNSCYLHMCREYCYKELGDEAI